jgi:GAG-pre-integrase domain
MISVFTKKYVQDVFYVENYLVNLLSISKSSKGLNCEIIFKEKIVIFQDLVTKEKIDEGYIENDLYILDNNKSIFNSRKNDNLSELWYKRVGHHSDKILNYMFDFSKDYCSKCEVCKLAKHVKLYFCNSSSKSNEVFEPVHSDVWGSAPVTSYNENIYIVILSMISQKQRGYNS